MEHVNNRARLFDPTDKFTSNQDVTVCSVCGCAFMELILIKQYKKDHAIILGQKPPAANDIGFYVFRCPKCRELFEPVTIHSGSQNIVRKCYDQFLEKMEEPMPEKEKPATDEKNKGEYL
jgi:hypothetical protein